MPIWGIGGGKMILKKIMKLTDYEAKMLLSAIQIFWKINDMSYIEDFLK